MRSAVRLFGICLGLGLASLAGAQGPINQTITLNADKVRIGDSTADPKPIGLFWKKDFDITAMPKWASLSVEASDTSYDNPVIVNGATLGILTPTPAGQWSHSVYEIALKDLRVGTNTVEIQSASKKNNYDDLYLRSITLILGYTDPPSITALSRTEAAAGNTVIVTGTGFNPEDSHLFFDLTEVPAFVTSSTQAFFRVPLAYSPGDYPLSVRASGAGSSTVKFTVLPGEPRYEALSFDGSAAPPDLIGDVSPKPGTSGRAYGDGKLTIGDAIRLLRRVLGIEPDPWP